jgi:hypothetical protein
VSIALAQQSGSARPPPEGIEGDAEGGADGGAGGGGLPVGFVGLLHAASALLKQRDRSAEALELFERALRIAPDNPTTLNHAGMAYGMSGLPRRGKQLFERALAANPLHHPARENLKRATGEVAALDAAEAEQGAKANLQVTNGGGDSIRLFYLPTEGSAEGDKEPLSTLQAGETVRFNAGLGHRFRVDGACVEEFTVDVADTEVVACV